MEEFFLVQQRYLVAAIHVSGFDGPAVLHPGHFLAVGAVLDQVVFVLVDQYRRFLHQRSGVKEGLFRPRLFSLVSAPLAVLLPAVHDRFAFRPPGHETLRLRGVGQAFGEAFVDAGHEHFPAGDKGNFLATRADGHFADATAEFDGFIGVHHVLRDDRYGYFAGLFAFAHRVQLAVIAKAEGTAAHGQKAYRVQVEVGELLDLRVGLRRHAEDVEGAAAFAQKVQLTIGARGRIAVFGSVGSELRMFLCLRAVVPQIPCDAACVVFTKFILATLLILVVKAIAIRRESDRFGGYGQHLIYPAAACRNAVQFRLRAGGELPVLDGILAQAGE